MKRTPFLILILTLMIYLNQADISMLQGAATTGNLELIYEYGDFFDTDKVTDESHIHSMLWVEGSYPPGRPYIVFTELDENRRGIIFRGYENTPAELIYRVPVDPTEQLPPLSLFMEIDVEVNILMGYGGGQYTTGSLICDVSPDGITWSDPQSITQVNSRLEFSSLSGNSYVRFRGSHVLLERFYVAIFRSEVDTLRVSLSGGGYATIQSGIDAAIAGNIKTILVADGLYQGTGNQAIDFKGHDLTLISENGPAACIIDCQYNERAFQFTSGEGRQAVLYGFTIKKGRADRGGGIYCQNSQPTISNCTIMDCRSEAIDQLGQGGGIYCIDASPLIRFCDIIGNYADNAPLGGQGGGVFLRRGAAIIEHCTFSSNRAEAGNSLDNIGGGICITELLPGQTEQPMIRGSVFYDNSAGDSGGAIATRGLRPVISNCTIVDNTAPTTGGVYIDTSATSSVWAKVKNCIIWNNQPDEFHHASSGSNGSGLMVEYCNIKGFSPWPGTDNIMVDPAFADEEKRDFHLQSLWGRWDPGSKTWIRDFGTSPCVDAGDPADSHGLERYPHGRRINMGAYGGSSQASRGEGSVVFHVDVETGDDMDHGQSREAAFKTIQTGINVARRNTGDAILVWPGTYREDIDFRGRAVIIQSAAEAAVLTVTNDIPYAVNFHSAEQSSSVLRNFIITGCPEGAVLVHNCAPTLSHLTVVNNDYGIRCFNAQNTDISHCIFWYNTYSDLTDCQATYSCIQRQEQGDGEGNIFQTPLFADPDNENYYLQSKFGRFWPMNRMLGLNLEKEGFWVLDDQSSPCIDAGKQGILPKAEAREHGYRLNMGAYGGTAYASKSPPEQTGDLNQDGLVDFLDLALFAEQWLHFIP